MTEIIKEAEEILKHNIKILVDNKTGLAEQLLAHKPQGVETVFAKNGMPVLKKNGKAIHSLYDPVKEAQTKLKNTELEFVKYIVVFGFGMGYLTEEIHKTAPYAKIMVFEPDLDILKTALSIKKFNFEKQEIIIHTDVEEFHSNCFVAYRTNDPITVITDPVWRRLHPELVTDLQKELEQFVIYSKIAENTAVLRLQTWIDFLLINLPDHSLRPSLSGLKQRFANKPIVVCSAGPSLNKNLHLLKGLEDKIIIISVNTAYKALVKEGIKPHFVMAIESFDISSLFDDLDLSETSFVAPVTSHPNLFKLPFKRIISFIDNYPVYAAWLSDEIPEETFLDMGGSVACSAFSFARYLGGNPIILIGQDLAYTDGQMYAKGTKFEDITLDFDEKSGKIKMNNMKSKEKIYEDTGSKQNLKTEVELKTVEGWYGGEVRTSEDFKFFKVWFESAARLAKTDGVRVINATEGGAKIHGFEHISLKEVLNEYENTEPHNMEKTLDSLKPINGYGAKLPVLYKELSVALFNIIKIAGEAIGLANKLSENIRPDSSDFHNKVARLEKLEKKLNKHTKKIPLLQGYAKGDILRIRTNPEDVVNLPPVEAWSANLSQSKAVSEAIRDAAFKLKAKTDEILKNF